MGTWRKSTYSDASGGSCIEVTNADGVMIRDTTDRSGPVLKVSAAAWRQFIASAASVAHGS